jgi:hypothetical protein
MSNVAPLTPERQRLAAVIDGVAQIKTELDRLAQAREKIGRPQIDLITEAEAKLATARVNEPARLVDEALGRTGDEQLTVAQAEIALEGIKAEMARRAAAQKLLDGEQERLLSRLRFAVADRHESVGAVVRAEALGSLFSEFDAALDRVADLRSVLSLLPGLSQRDLDHTAVVIRPGTSAGLAAWRVALAALETDPAAALPDAEPPLAAGAKAA